MNSYRLQRALWITALALLLWLTELLPAQAQQSSVTKPPLAQAAQQFQQNQVLLQQQRLTNQLAELELEYARLQAEKRRYTAAPTTTAADTQAADWLSRVTIAGEVLTVIVDGDDWRWQQRQLQEVR